MSKLFFPSNVVIPVPLERGNNVFYTNAEFIPNGAYVVLHFDDVTVPFTIKTFTSFYTPRMEDVFSVQPLISIGEKYQPAAISDTGARFDVDIPAGRYVLAADKLAPTLMAVPSSTRQLEFAVSDAIKQAFYDGKLELISVKTHEFALEPFDVNSSGNFQLIHDKPQVQQIVLQSFTFVINTELSTTPKMGYSIQAADRLA